MEGNECFRCDVSIEIIGAREKWEAFFFQLLFETFVSRIPKKLKRTFCRDLIDIIVKASHETGHYQSVSTANNVSHSLDPILVLRAAGHLKCHTISHS